MSGPLSNDANENRGPERDGVSSSRFQVSSEGGRGWLGRIADHNPFFLLSGLCILVGCYLISAAVHDNSNRASRLMVLLLVLNVYEAAVIGLGLYLARGRGIMRDAAYLLLLEVVLLLDVTFLVNELMTTNLKLGAAIGLAAMILAMLKVGVMGRFLRARMSRSAWCTLAAAMLLLYGLPWVFRLLGQHVALKEPAIYGFWWLSGLLIAVSSLPRKWFVPKADCDEQCRRLVNALGVALRWLPALSVVAHVRAAHYVYTMSDPTPAHWAPVLVGATYAWAVIAPRWQLASWPVTRRVVAAGAVAAVLMSLGSADSLQWSPAVLAGWVISPLRLTLLAAAGVWAVLWWQSNPWPELAAGLAALALTILGNQPGVMGARLAWGLDYLRRGTGAAVPDTMAGWGIVAVSGAFVLLGVGALFSLRRTPRHRAAPAG